MGNVAWSFLEEFLGNTGQTRGITAALDSKNFARTGSRRLSLM